MFRLIILIGNNVSILCVLSQSFSLSHTHTLSLSIPGQDPSSDLIPLNLRPWHPFGPDMISAVTEHLPATVWETLSPHMYLSFWSLSLYDISVPTEKYEIELKRLRERSKL